MAITQYIVAPLVGGFIGYFTNALAIRMLFRPHSAKYVFGIHLPFTPGIIPKEKGRIASAIGNVIGENLMSHEVLQQYLLSDTMVGKLRSGIEEFVEKQKENDETLAQFIGHYLSEEEIMRIVESIENNLSGQIQVKLSDSAVGDRVAHLAMEHVINNLLSGNESEELLDSIIGMPRALGRGILGTVLAALQDPAERMLGRNINDILRTNGKEMASNLLGSELDGLLDKPVKQMLSGKDEQINKVVNMIESIYQTAVKEHLPRILNTLDISKIVSGRINEMDVAETEKLILQVMNKELKAIVWLGAGLGFLMGWVNVLV